MLRIPMKRHSMAESPCVLTTSEYGWSDMERIAEATQDNSMTAYVVSKKTMEVNHKHSLVMSAAEPMLIIDQSQGCRLVGAVLENAAATESFHPGKTHPCLQLHGKGFAHVWQYLVEYRSEVDWGSTNGDPPCILRHKSAMSTWYMCCSR